MTADTVVGEWGRRKLLAMLAGVVAFVVVVAGVLAYTVVTAVGTDGDASSVEVPDRGWPTNAAGIRGAGYRDEVAARPMLKSGESDMTQAAPALDAAASIQIGESTRTGPAGVPTGFDHTPEGAIAQLAAIETSVLEPMSVQYARDVYTAWAHSAAGFGRWELAQSIRDFHRAAGTVDGDGSVSVTATPVGAQIKGTDGPDWVLACVQLDISAAVVQDVRFGFGHCERMQWDHDRWTIASGTPPAQAPSTWPGSERSVKAGWLRWVGPDDQDTPASDPGDVE